MVTRWNAIAALAGLAAGALVAGTLTFALAPAQNGAIPGNSIRAGHLALQVNRGQGSDLSFDDLMPGEQRTGDQLVTADLAGVATADLVLTLYAGRADAAARLTAVTVLYSDPQPADGIGWTAGVCAPHGGYPHAIRYPTLASLAHARTAAMGTLTESGDGLCVRFVLGLDRAAGNAAQGASLTLSWRYTLEQTSAGPA